MAYHPTDTDDDFQTAPDAGPSFGDILSQYEQGKQKPREDGAEGRDGVVVALSPEFVFVDIGFKTEGVIEAAVFAGDLPKKGETLRVTVTGRNPEGYYTLSRIKVARPKDWSSLEKAFEEKRTIGGVVSGLVKGGLTVDIGVRAFLPASRSGTKDAVELEKLVGMEITCRITKLDVTAEDVVVDRRVVLEEQSRLEAQGRLAALRAGDTTTGTVRTLTSYGAFIDIGGTEGLLHISDIAWGHVSKPEDFLAVGQEVRVRILKIDAETNKIGLGLKQLEPEPWEKAPAKYAV